MVRRLALALVGLLFVAGVFPSLALAHGPVDPAATKYLARITRVPAGLDAKIVDGDLRIWLRVARAETAVVLDYGGGPYLRFSHTGVEVNANSAMYFLNQTPAESPPANVSPAIPPKWQHASGGHDYLWHDGRLQALSSIAIAPGTTYVGRWRIPITIDGQLTSISGSIFHAADPSIVWFWPIVVLLASLLAALRLRRAALDARLARVLAIAALIPTGVGDAGRDLHGRPTISAGQLIELAIILAVVAWGLRRVLSRPPGFFGYLAISLLALWTGLVLASTLTDGYVLIALPAFVARATTVLCLSCGAGLLVLAVSTTGRRSADESMIDDPTDGWEIDERRAESWT